METIANNAQRSRRGFLKASLGVAGSLLLSFHLPAADAVAVSTPSQPLEPAAFKPNAFISIGQDGKVTLVMSFVEMGQGVYTAVAMLIAEELEVDVRAVTLEHAPADEARYAHPLYKLQLTGGSSTVRAAWLAMREAAAGARMMLVAAAAAQWNVAPETCRASAGAVRHVASGRALEYGALAAQAARMTAPQPADIRLKPESAFTLVGSKVPRLDTPIKIDGRAKFGIDADVPGMKFAAVAACPVFGGKLAKVDDSKARAVKGVRKIVRLDNAVAVIADHNGAARKGLAALAITWDEGPNAAFSSQEWQRQLEQAARTPGRVALRQGDFDGLLRAGARRAEAVYHAPFLAHATMEPMNCTAHVRKDGAEIWTGTQAPARAQEMAARALGVAPSQVTVHNHYLGGGFGRRLDVDYVVQAVLIARGGDYPVKLVWSREEDMQHGMYRPFYSDEIAAAVDAQGRLLGISHRVAGSSVRARYAPQWLKDGIDTDAVAAAESPYEIAHKFVEYHQHESPVPTGFWRGVGPTHNTFVTESFIDELAYAAGTDPLRYRQSMLGGQPRALAVLALAAEKAGWGRAMGAGEGMGLAVISWWGSHAACVVECAVGTDGQVRLKRVVMAVDCGLTVNPDGVAAQMEGGAVYALSAALYGKLTVEKGRIEQSNFHDYAVLRMNEMPVFETHLVAGGGAPGGIGELGTAVAGPALANAVFAASGKRTRTMPVA
jgi:CO/xanthine dehydrogenase Mo-binding subunit